MVHNAGDTGASPTLNTRDFDMDISPDGTNWTTIATVEDNTANVTAVAAVATTRWVRLHVLTPTRTTDTTTRIAEVEVLAPRNSLIESGPTQTDLAFGQPATADGQCTLESGADKAVDGLPKGFPWNEWCSSAGEPGAAHWLAVDLGTPVTIGTVIVRHAGYGGQTPDWNTRDFEVQLSDDGVTWRTAASVTGNTAASTVSTINDTARYVRLWITKPSGDGDPAARVFELEVYAPIS